MFGIFKVSHMPAGTLTISERIAVSNYLLKNTDKTKLQRIMEEILKSDPPMEVKPPIEFIIKEVCDHCQITVDEFKTGSSKRKYVNAQMIGAYIVTSIHIKLKKNNKLYIRKEILDQLYMTDAKVLYLIQKARNFITVYENFENEMKYLALRISWMYLREIEEEAR